MKKSTVLELTINPGYVRDWGIWEAVRELIQNAADAHDIGYEMSMGFVEEGDDSYLWIENEGAVISRDTLLLGKTSKANNSSQRGQFGEGFKLAWLVLARNNRDIWCKSGDERWVPYIEHSTSYGSNLLKVKVSPLTYEAKVSTTVQISKDEWDVIRARMLFLSKPNDEDFIELDGDKILVGDDYAGNLYAKGIYVGKLPGRYKYGYDLKDVRLDRDRRLADPWSLRSSVMSALSKALEIDALGVESLFGVLNADWEEARIVGDSIGSTDLSQRIAAFFLTTNGENAIPVASTAESIEAKHYGKKGIVLTDGLRRLVEKETGEFDKCKNDMATDAVRQYSVDELDKTEIANFMWAIELVAPLVDKFDTMVVDFFSDSVQGSWSDGRKVSLSKKIMNNRRVLISTLVHEVAHEFGEDGTVDHRDAIDRIFGEAVVNLTSK